MASIVHRGDKHCVVYTYITDDGEKKQKWETYDTLGEAKRRRTEVEYHQQLGTLVVPSCKTLDELLEEYVSLYGKQNWSISVYTTNISRIENYISPMIGKMKLRDITTRVLEKYYLKLLQTKAVTRMTDSKYRKEDRFVTPSTVREIHKLLRNCFQQAVKWDLMEKNPALNATIPKEEHKKREIWDAATLFHAIEICEDDRLKIAMNLSFACSLRLGELLGLTWDCVDISEKSRRAGSASIYINKELQRANKDVLDRLDQKDVIFHFPEQGMHNTTVLILKTPKTRSSVRKVFLPETLAQILVEWKREQERAKEALGDEYSDFNLVLAGPMGMPTENGRIEKLFRQLIKENDLPYVVFHSIRHTSITYKLKLNGGDIKAVQGDSGHSQAKMVTDQYSHILDENRVENARLIEESFYKGRGQSPSKPAAATEPVDGVDPDVMKEVLSNPAMVSLLKTLAQTL